MRLVSSTEPARELRFKDSETSARLRLSSWEYIGAATPVVDSKHFKQDNNVLVASHYAIIQSTLIHNSQFANCELYYRQT